MAQKQKARPKPGKSESAESVTAPCAACGATIRVGDRIGHAYLPIGVDFDGRLLTQKMLLCAACVDEVKRGAAAQEDLADAILARQEGVTLQ
jgi:hypothetical protein